MRRHASLLGEQAALIPCADDSMILGR